MKDHTKGKEATEADAIVMPVAAFDLCPGTIADLPARADGTRPRPPWPSMPDVPHGRDSGTTSRTERD